MAGMAARAKNSQALLRRCSKTYRAIITGIGNKIGRAKTAKPRKNPAQLSRWRSIK